MLIIISIALPNNLNAQTIAITETNPTELLCSGQPVDVNFDIDGTFNSGNVFQVQLSNKTGSFTTPTTIGTLSWSGVGASTVLTATGVIPTNIPAGSGYRIRIVSTNPAATGINTFKQFVISNRCGCNTELIKKEWDLSFGGSSADNLLKTINVQDGGYLLAGTSSSPVSGNKTVGTNGLGDFYVVKIDSLGALKWQFSFGGTMNEELKSVTQLPDGGYLLVGISQSGNDGNKSSTNNGAVGTYDYWIVRLTSTGSKLWDRSFGGSLNDYAYDVKPAEDGNYLIVGSSNSSISGNKTSSSYGGFDYWIIKINTSGTKAWESSYGGSLDDIPLKVITRPNGNIVLGGYSRSAANTGTKTTVNYGLADYWMVEINSTGTVLNENAYGGAQDDIMQDVINTQDGSLLITGSSESGISGNKSIANFGSKDMWMIKANYSTILWQKGYGTTSVDPSMSLKETSEGSYVICGSALGNTGNKTSASYGGNDMWFISLDADGNEIVQESFGGSMYDQANSVTYTTDGGYLVGGFSQSPANTGNKESPNYGSEDFWIIKLKILPLKYTLDKTNLCQKITDTARVIINCSNLGSNPLNIELSDASGSFANPTIIGTATPSNPKIKIPYFIPNSIAPGTYKIRIVLTSSPQFIGDTISGIVVNESPNLTGVAESCGFGKHLLATGVQSYTILQWKLNNVDLINETNNDIYPIQFGAYTVQATIGNCVVKSDAFNVVPANVNSISNLYLYDGTERFLCDNTTAEVLAKVKDNTGGNILATTSANLFIDPTLQYYVDQPYARRHWDITPVSSGAARVTVYIQQSDFNHYNSNAPTNFPKMPTGPSDIAGKDNLVVMQCHGNSVTKLPGTYSGSTEFYDKSRFTLLWNATINMWELSFDVTAFSGIYLITLAPNVLPVEFISFTGVYNEKENAVQLNWVTATETNCRTYEIQRMVASNNFETIGTTTCQNQINNVYQFADVHYTSGDNYYRIKQVDLDGSTQYSNTILVIVNAATAIPEVKVWSNESKVFIQNADAMIFQLFASNGSMLITKEISTADVEPIDIAQLPKGLYVATVEDKQGKRNAFKLYK